MKFSNMHRLFSLALTPTTSTFVYTLSRGAPAAHVVLVLPFDAQPAMRDAPMAANATGRRRFRRVVSRVVS
jgi:hypothetical protein